MVSIECDSAMVIELPRGKEKAQTNANFPREAEEEKQSMCVCAPWWFTVAPIWHGRITHVVSLSLPRRGVSQSIWRIDFQLRGEVDKDTYTHSHNYFDIRPATDCFVWCITCVNCAFSLQCSAASMSLLLPPSLRYYLIVPVCDIDQLAFYREVFWSVKLLTTPSVLLFNLSFIQAGYLN